MTPRRVLSLGLLSLCGCTLTFVDERGYLEKQVPDNTLIVDVASVGGPCDDARPPEEARSVTTPWCTLRRALEAAPAGWPVRLRAGTYPELEVTGPGGRSVELVIRPYPFEQATVEGVTLRDQQYLKFEGLHFTQALQLENGVSNVTFADCDVTGSSGGLIIAMAPVDDVTFTGCTVHDLPLGGNGLSGRGVFATAGGHRLVITRNRFERIKAKAIQVANVDGVVLEGNTVDEAVKAVEITTSQGVAIRRNRIVTDEVSQLQNLQGLIFEGNLVTGGAYWAIQLTSVAGARIVGNTLWANGKGAFVFDDSGGPASTGVVLQNNVLQSLDGSNGGSTFALEDYNLIGSGYRNGTHDLMGPPRFVDPATGDFHLAAGSPGIDAALADGAPELDLDGKPRQDDPAVADTGAGSPPFGDLGAFEGR